MASKGCVYLLQHKQVMRQRVEVWSEDSSLALQACFDCTDGSVFVDSFDININLPMLCAAISNSTKTL